jgi:enoyl-CoA hydratase/carnithine racemase
MATAKRIILGCDMVDGKTAEEIGLVQWSVPDHELSFFCNSLAARISQSSAAALAASKRCLVKTESSIDSGLEAERHETLCLLETADTQSRVRAFLEGRSAR